MLTTRFLNDKISKSLVGDEVKWSLKIEQNIEIHLEPAILFIKVSFMSMIKLFIESLILAQDERWRRA